MVDRIYKEVRLFLRPGLRGQPSASARQTHEHGNGIVDDHAPPWRHGSLRPHHLVVPPRPGHRHRPLTSHPLALHSTGVSDGCTGTEAEKGLAHQILERKLESSSFFSADQTLGEQEPQPVHLAKL
jgi:hypothetical protein